MLIFHGEIEELGNDRLFSYHTFLKNNSNQQNDNAIHHFSFPEIIEQLVERINHSVPV